VAPTAFADFAVVLLIADTLALGGGSKSGGPAQLGGGRLLFGYAPAACSACSLVLRRRRSSERARVGPMLPTGMASIRPTSS